MSYFSKINYGHPNYTFILGQNKMSTCKAWSNGNGISPKHKYYQYFVSLKIEMTYYIHMYEYVFVEHDFSTCINLQQFYYHQFSWMLLAYTAFRVAGNATTLKCIANDKPLLYINNHPSVPK